ncbi:hypothetical protein Mp_Vg00460 [Marchantia polymorpha subsp. ruderalis]|uniref:Uncharacterized protein n=1 Tax=Marchantia polymorpha TaxID=3197 RepID=A0A2R6VWU1_MARPO|nr:hypothetical protein MARPO_YB0006 [Marchantia polymorpha]BBN20532.1 hypothetical protein Mp_Vg00460 [Marchantia polymorpha subsp. ruderalis]|eukprot:PTQ26026.1 hypothetical protein MARPO_YB0006 [Marchantia polymorpha]
MWQQRENTWECLWRLNLEQPHTLCIASWFVRGIAATAEAHIIPLRGFTLSSQTFRLVLLTCCKDGVISLWTEIGNQVSPRTENQFKLAFFVRAVIDVNTSLKGVLGQDIFISWPEARGDFARKLSVPGDTSSISPSKNSDMITSEWLVEVEPSGSVTLWSVQRLDDLSSSRGQFVQLWQHKPSLLSCPSIPSGESNVTLEDCGRLLSMKAVVHMPHGTLCGPPSSVDVLEIWSDNLLLWSCIWPPVSTIGGRSLVAGIVAVGGIGMHLVSWKVDIKVSLCQPTESLVIQEIACHVLKENISDISSVSSSKGDEEVDDSKEAASLEIAPEIEETEDRQRDKTVVEGHLLGYTTVQSFEVVESGKLHLF